LNPRPELFINKQLLSQKDTLLARLLDGDLMPTYRVGAEPLKTRKSMREVLCEQCGKAMGKAYFSQAFTGLTADQAIEHWPYLRMDIKVHESQCPAIVEKKPDE
jgi:hypothetical protein